MATILATLGITLTVFFSLWLLSLRIEDASIVDIYWGPGFVLIGWAAFLLTGHPTFGEYVFLAALTIWGLRLGWYISSRHRGEDARYRAMRQHHGDAFAIKSLWIVFGLQAVIQWLASSPALVLAVSQQPAAVLSKTGSLIFFVTGLILFLVGFVIELVADWAVAQFRSNTENKGQLLKTGLHAYIRHPNYLGEIILQWGFGFMAFGLSELNLLAFFGPILMTALIIKLSGVPMLEEQLAKRPGFADWKAQTGALWFKRLNKL